MYQPKAGSQHRKDPLTEPAIKRLRLLGFFAGIIAVAMIARLFIMQVVQHEFYTALASGTQDIFKQLLPRRGTIYIKDKNNPDDLYPLAMNRNVYQLFVDNRDNPDHNQIAVDLDPVFDWGIERRLEILYHLRDQKPDDPYIPISGAEKITEEQKEIIEQKNITGLYFVKKPYRYFPEKTFASHVIGFYGQTPDGKPMGMYGAEGYYQEILSGIQGFIEGKRDAFGAWIPVSNKEHKAAKHGSDIILTLDRTVQFKACELLKQIADEVEAQSATSIILNPKTGAVMAMCNYPDFDPNKYNEVDSIDVFNNTAIFKAYEPGSVFKTIAMAGALDKGVISPELTFDDPGSVKIGKFTIHNALRKTYGTVDMSRVLQKSINTGMLFIVDKLGKDDFRKYVEKFGYGEKSDIGLDTEVAGNISSLSKEGDIYVATGSFGQGLTVTPLQIVASYGAMANGGILMKPRIIEEIRHPNGEVEKFEPEELREVISSHAAHLITGILTSVIEETYKRVASIPGYYFGGKTGTAQIPGKGGYLEDTNHTFAGYGPTEDPQFVIVAKFEKPNRAWAESTAAPYFGKMAQFLVKYLGIPPTRE